ncbi:MAG: 16S rRNA (cytidine(1402)-2'-O)-methyltransferase [Candidatus Devosia euplotis]|nr:16S rRNA (cytidine(1402)-2'-O)-methyltransferase [Candidatus Devosia euplotis]
MADPAPGYFIAGTTFAAPLLAPGLYVVATPIGNLRDITIRALETLAAVDAVLCEDTRMSARLLDHYGIKTRRIALHEHNERAKADGIVSRIAGGGCFALISDAGTPLLSDPGFPLIRAMAEAGLPVFAIPGASALLSALVVAGLPTDSFAFHGFLPPKAGARINALRSLSD